MAIKYCERRYLRCHVIVLFVALMLAGGLWSSFFGAWTYTFFMDIAVCRSMQRKGDVVNVVININVCGL